MFASYVIHIVHVRTYSQNFQHMCASEYHMCTVHMCGAAHVLEIWTIHKYTIYVAMYIHYAELMHVLPLI